MEKNLFHGFLKKAATGLLALVFVLSMACILNVNGSVAQAADTDYFITETCEGVTISENMTAPKPTTEGKESYIFAGYYTDETCATPVTASTDETVYAKFVPAELMSVKVQVAAGTAVDTEKVDMRLVTTVDSLQYKEVGFEVYFNGSTTPVIAKTTTVYKRILVTGENGTEYGYSPTAFEDNAEYFTTVNLINIANKNFDKSFFIKPYWKTLDGTTVYGMSRMARVSDSYNDIVNVPVRLYTDDTVAAGSFDLAYDTDILTYVNYDNGDLYASVTVADDATNKKVTVTTPAEVTEPNGMVANIRFQVNDGATMASNTTFAVTSDTFTDAQIADVLYNKFSITYSGTPDTSWYDEFADGNTFVIATPDDLYGLAEIVNSNTDLFKGDTIYMAADIVVNRGTAYINDDGTAGFTLADSSDKLYDWTPISPDEYNSSGTLLKYRFNGTFDGMGNTISGIYMLEDEEGNTNGCYQGLFGITNTSSLITNFSLKNSVFIVKEGCGSSDGTQADLGSIVGQPMGDVTNVYSDAIVVSEGGIEVGGLFGRLNPAGASNTSDITNCWFDGEVYVTYDAYDETTATYGNSKEMYVGGIVGKAFNNGTINLTACHNSGKITCIQNALATYNATSGAENTKFAVAGLVGGVTSSNAGFYFNMTQCMSTGEIVAKRIIPTTVDETTTYTLTQVTSGLGVANLVYNKITTTSTDDEGNAVYDHFVVTDCLYATDYFSTGYQRSGGKYNVSNCDGAAISTYEGVDAWTSAERLGIYTNAEKDATKYWVVKEEGLVTLKSFCDEWIDFGWYYNNKTDDADTFVIETAEELYGFSYVSQTDTFSGDTVQLGADIKMNTGMASYWAAGTTTPKRTFTSIGRGTAALPVEQGGEGKTPATADSFAGTFDGKGYTISGLYIYDTVGQGVGFFSQSVGTIKDFKLVNSYIVQDDIYHNTGAIVGNLRKGSVSGVYTDAFVESKQSTSMATAGIVGIMGTKSATSTISNCWFEGTVQANKNYVGGIIGRMYAGTTKVEDCISNGYVSTTYVNTSTNDDGTIKETNSAFVGGLVGAAHSATSATIRNCLNMTTVAATDDGSIGAVVGRVYNVATTFENVYTTVDKDGGKITGLGNEAANTQTITGTPVLIAEEDFTGKNAYTYSELDFTDTWGVVDNGMPVLQSLYDGSVVTDLSGQKVSTDWYYNKTSYAKNSLEEGTSTFTILDVDDFFGFARIVNGEYAFESKVVELVANGDFDLNPGWTASATAPSNVWSPIGKVNNVSYFDGTFDGNMNTIKGVYVNETTANSGLFGYVGLNGTVQNFRIENSYYTSNKNNLSSVVGVLKGNVKNVYSSADIVNTASHTTGGIVAIFDRGSDVTNEVEVSNCWFNGTVTNTSTTSGTYTGGVIGRLYKGKINVNNILNTGTVTSAYTKDYWAWAGGLIGGIEYGSGSSRTLLLVDLSNSVSAGDVFVSCGTGGSVIGRSQRATVTIENVYTTDSIAATEGSTATWDTTYGITGTGRYSVSNCDVTGSPVVMTTQLEGDNAYVYTELGFYTTDNEDGFWTTVADDTPVLKSFVSATASDYSDVQRISKGWYYNAFTYTKASSYANATTTYAIKDVDDMYGFADFVNVEGKTFVDLTVTLGNDIIFNDVTTGEEAAGWADGTITAPTTSWVPIGTVNGNAAVNAFQGTFDGNGHTISGLYVASDEQYLGLFRKIQDATICNLRMENSYINSLVDSGAMSAAASVVGGGDGKIDSVYSNAIVRGSQIVGGIISRVSQSTQDNTSFEISNSWFDGKINIDYAGKDSLYVGGVVGYVVHGTTVIDTCLYTGTIDLQLRETTADGSRTGWGVRVGGLCGADNGTTTGHVQAINCISAGAISSTIRKDGISQNVNVSQMNHVFGTGRHADTWAKNTYVIPNLTETIESTGSVTHPTTLIERASNSLAANYSVNGEFTVDNLVGYGAQMWTELSFTDADRLAADNAALEEGEEEITVAGPIWAAIADDLPVPATLADNALEMTVGKPDTTLAGSGTEADPWKITTVEELAGFAELSKTETFAGEYVALGNDIIINSGEKAADWVDDKTSPTLPWYTIIGTASNGKRFEGTFDGQNYTISGLCLEDNSTYLGLFAATEEGSAIKNLRLENSYIEQEGDGYTGSIVSDCRGTVSNVYSDAIIRSGNEQNGGIIGRANGWSYVKDADEDDTTDGRTSVAIDNCWYAGTIVLHDEGRYAGGIIGTVIQGEWTLTNCVFTGKITCEYTGTSYAYVGGMCGALNTPSTVASSSMETKLTLNSCISAGTIKTANKDYGAGAILGRAKADIWFNSTTTSTTDETTGETVETTTTTYKDSKVSHLVMNNVFATREAGYQEVGHAGTQTEKDSAGTAYTATPTVTGAAVWTNNADRLVGYCTEEVKDSYYDGGSLDFTSTFVIREEGVPVPATFKDLDNVTQVATSDLNTILALTTMDSTWSLENAVNYGLGHYVLTSTGKTYDNYTAYLTALEAQGFTAYTTLDETGTDGVYNVIYTRTTGEWVLNVLFVQNTGEVTLTISNGLDSLSADLEPEASTTSGDVTLSMLQLEGSLGEVTLGDDYYYGNSFVFKLPNGHFIINDGGNSGDMAGLMAYLRKEAGLAAEDTTSKIYIDAWTVTHQHGDHFGVMRNIVSNPGYAEQLVVNAIYLNEPNQKAMLCYPDESNVMNTVKLQYRGMRMLKDANGNMPKVYWCQTGQTYYFDGLTMNILQSQEQIPVDSYAKRNAGGSTGTDYNTVSTNMLFTTSNGKKVFITGDSNYENMEVMMDMYGTSSTMLANINVYQAMHHGKNTSMSLGSILTTSADNTFTDYLAGLITGGKFDVTLFPCSVIYSVDGTHDVGAFPQAGDANDYLITKSTTYYDYGDGTIKVTLGDTITSGLDTSVDTGTEDSETGTGEE